MQREMTSPEGGVLQHPRRRQRRRGRQVLRLVGGGGGVDPRSRPGDGLQLRLRRQSGGQLGGRPEHPAPTKTYAQTARCSMIRGRAAAAASDRCRRKLYEVRSRRVWPGRDDKVLTSWNGLMLGAFAQAGGAGRPELRSATAARAADFLLTRMRPPTADCCAPGAGRRGEAQRLPGGLRLPDRCAWCRCTRPTSSRAGWSRR